MPTAPPVGGGPGGAGGLGDSRDRPAAEDAADPELATVTVGARRARAECGGWHSARASRGSAPTGLGAEPDGGGRHLPAVGRQPPYRRLDRRPGAALSGGEPGGRPPPSPGVRTKMGATRSRTVLTAEDGANWTSSLPPDGPSSGGEPVVGSPGPRARHRGRAPQGRPAALPSPPPRPFTGCPDRPRTTDPGPLGLRSDHRRGGTGQHRRVVEQLQERLPHAAGLLAEAGPAPTCSPPPPSHRHRRRI